MLNDIPNQSEIDESQDVDLIIRRNNYKLTADKIKQILSKVLNDPSKSYRRWIWELMQNAKDVPNKQFQRVSIQIVLKQDELIFKHNGDPFMMGNITGLIQQVSSKASDSSNEEVTGKFGTGFISTHLLSDIIKVNGIVNYKNTHRSFEVLLDRAGRTSEELLPKIETALERIRQIEDDAIFPIVNNYPSTRLENSYDTAFTYTLTSTEKQKAAKAGIEDLIHTLPVTLVNIPKIKRVEVINEIANTHIIYECSEVEQDGAIRKVKVDIFGGEVPQRLFLVYKAENIFLISEVNNFDELKLIEHFGEQPNLYRDFPLIGSEKFYFPFAINGTHFFPTEDRDGVYLNSEEAPDAIENREIIENAIEASIEFTNWLINNGAQNRYVCAYSRLPDYKWEDFSKEWYQDLQKSWRGQLLDTELVETQSEDIITLREALIPYYGATDEIKLKFHKMVTPFLGENKVPHEDLLLKWIKASGPKSEIEQWADEIRCDLEGFLKKLQDVKSIDGLSEHLDADSGETSIKWLNKVFSFIITEKQSDLLNEYSIIPNQYGDFFTLDELFLDDPNSPIPDHFLDILKTLGSDWRIELIDRDIILPGLNIDKKDLPDISETINGILQAERKNAYNQPESVFLQRINATEILTDILRVNEAASKKDSFKNQFFLKCKELIQFEEEFIAIDNSSGFNFVPAIKLMIQVSNKVISDLETIDAIAELLEQTNQEAISWLDGYLTLLESNQDYKTFLETGNIIANRNGKLLAYKEVSNYGTDETPLDDELLDILKGFDSSKEWKTTLVLDGISINLPNTIKFEELGAEIEAEVKAIQAEDAHESGTIESNRDNFLSLIEWCGENHELADKYLSYFQTASSRLFFTLTLGNRRISKDVISLLKDEASMELLSEISKANLDPDQMKELIQIAQSLGSLDEILKHANDLKEVKEDFDFKLKIGKTVENYFEQALLKANFNAKVIPRGIGSSDFEIKNTDNGKSYFIELKSYLNNSSLSFRFAASQAKHASKNEDNYAIGFLARPSNIHDVNDQYISSNFGYRKNLADVFEPGLNDYEKLNEIQQSSGRSKLHLVIMEEIRIAVNREVMLQNTNTFNHLIEDIKHQIS
jgi:hypothetical protein